MYRWFHGTSVVRVSTDASGVSRHRTTTLQRNIVVDISYCVSGLLFGLPGHGSRKSWLACALGHKACRDRFSVLYRRAPRLFADLATARGEGRLPCLMKSLERTRLLIIDDWGPEPLNAEQPRDLLEIVDDREGKGSLLITSQIPISRWHEIIGDPTLGDAILDRVVHRAHRIELTGESLRKRQALVQPEGLTNAKQK
jgi:DNA replication protein DnaC